jgi:tripartite-type tricarboxylate transporter receptor subunit TctC
VVHPSVPAQSVQELIALYKSKPGEYNYSSAGDGTGPHLAAELLKTLAGIDLVNISYNGSGPALVGVLSGQTSLMFNTMVQSRPLVEAGKLRALAVTSSKRSSAMPELPTLSEAGVTGFEMDGWFGLVAPAATPKAIIEQLNLEVRRVLASAEIAERLTKLGSEPSAIVTPEQFGNYIQVELTKWAKVVKAAGMRLPE